MRPNSSIIQVNSCETAKPNLGNTFSTKLFVFSKLSDGSVKFYAPKGYQAALIGEYSATNQSHYSFTLITLASNNSAIAGSWLVNKRVPPASVKDRSKFSIS